MVDGAVTAHAFQGAAHPGEQVSIGDALEFVENALLVGSEDLAGQTDEGIAFTGVDMDGH